MKHVFVWTIKDFIGLSLIGAMLLATGIVFIFSIVEGRKKK